MNKHTPAPWSVQSDPCHFDTLSDVVGGEVKQMQGIKSQMFVSVGGWADVSEQEANARLISAAPDLLEALKLVVDEIDGTFPFESLAAARAAISKAEGTKP